MKKKIGIALFASVLSLALFVSCGGGSKVSGTYSDGTGLTSYTFGSGGKVTTSAMGIEVSAKYKVEGNKVKLILPQGAIVFDIKDDGSLEGPMGVVLTKEKAK
jgi:hypothetical protein